MKKTHKYIGIMLAIASLLVAVAATNPVKPVSKNIAGNGLVEDLSVPSSRTLSVLNGGTFNYSTGANFGGNAPEFLSDLGAMATADGMLKSVYDPRGLGRITGATGGTGALGGEVDVRAGSGSGAVGGVVYARGGAGSGASGGGFSANGGNGTNSFGGSVDLSGGNGANANGGSIRITGGATGGGPGGSIDLRGGQNATCSGGTWQAKGGTSSAGRGGNITMNGTTAAAGDINTSSGGGSIDTTDGGGSINTSTAGGSITTNASGGAINTSTSGGAINTSNSGGAITTASGGGSINTTGTGTIQLGVTGTRTTLTGAATGNRSASFPENSSGGYIPLVASNTGKPSLLTEVTGRKIVTLASNFTTTLATNTDTALSIPIASGESWLLEFYLTVTTPAASMKFQISAPTGATVEGWVVQNSGASSARFTAINALNAATPVAVSVTTGVRIWVKVTNSTTAGNVALGAASVTATQTSTILAGSTVHAEQF